MLSLSAPAALVNASTAFQCGHPYVWLFRSLLAERRCCHRRLQWDLTSPYQTTRALEKRRSRRLYQRTKTVRTNAPAPLPQRPTPLPNHSLNSLDSTVMQLLHPSHLPVATRTRRLARRDLQRDFRSFIIITTTVVYREVRRIHQ